MPEVELSVLITVIVAIFSAGITWGVMSAKAKAHEVAQKSTVDELKEAVKELRALTTELQVMKSSTSRNESDIKDHEKRILALEIAVAKLQPCSD